MQATCWNAGVSPPCRIVFVIFETPFSSFTTVLERALVRAKMASEDGPFGSNSVLVVDLKAAAGASQFNVGAALWQVMLKTYCHIYGDSLACKCAWHSSIWCSVCLNTMSG